MKIKIYEQVAGRHIFERCYPTDPVLPRQGELAMVEGMPYTVVGVVHTFSSVTSPQQVEILVRPL